MYLKKVDIFGFKSFAERISVEFEGGITAIVGPNGCGKTNIVDAVRWAIGEQKASVLRSSTMDNVIFNGTKNRKSLGYAEVSLVIENTKGILPSEYTEIKVTRRCFRDGQSNYLLNSVMCRLRDITALFMDTGMGADAYSVIELKMVNDILSHRTQDRRRLFEEAAGITKYKEHRREALYKLEVAHESLNEASIEIRNRQRAVNAYEKIVQKQQEAKEVSEKLRILEIDYHQRLYSKLIGDTKYLESELEEREKERQELQLRYSENEQVIDKYKTELNVIESKLNSARERLSDINANISEVQAKISISEQSIQHLRDNIERYTKERVELENQILDLSHYRNEIEEKILDLRNTLLLLENSLAEKKVSLEKIEKKVKFSRDELQDLSGKHSTVSMELSQKRNEYEIIRNRLDDQLNRCSKLTKENIAKINKIAELDTEKDSIEMELTSLKEKLEKFTFGYERLRNEKESYKEQFLSLEKDIINRTHEIEKIEEKVKFHINLIESFEDYAEGVKYLVKDKNIPDISVVIEKIQVEDKFKIAIETALGEISNYLIVNNLEAAKELAEVLRKQEKGKVTFILKDHLNKAALNIFQNEFPEILSYEGVYGWADKFVKYTDEYMPLYKYLLDEYIIVGNLEVALKLSQDNFIKFITLDGDIVTGGFLRAGSVTNIETVKIAREKLITDYKDRISELTSLLERDRIAYDEVKKSLEQIDLDTLNNEIQEIKTKVQGIENRIGVIEYLKEQTNAVIDGNNLENAALSDSNKELSARMDALILDIGTAENEKYQREMELKHFTEELESITDELTSRRDEYTNFNIEVTKVKGELMNFKNEVTRVIESIESKRKTIVLRKTECEDYEKEIEELKNVLDFRNEEILEVPGLRYKLELFAQIKEEIDQEFNNVKSEYDSGRETLNDLERELRSLNSRKEDKFKSVYDIEKKLIDDRHAIREHKERIKEQYEEEIQYLEYEDKDIFDYTPAKTEIEKLRARLKQLGGSGQMELGIYEQEKKELERLIEEKNDLLKAEENLLDLIEQINKTAQEKFSETFEKIRINFQTIFRELFMENDEADLKLVFDPENPDPLDAKIDIIAKPRGKRPQLIDQLSGGEKTLTAIALLFAIYQVKPSPFCILDEVDAPLDDANIDRFIKIIRKFSEDTQFIIVTHNKRTMEASDSMYGVTMVEEGISAIVNVKFSDQLVSTN